MNLAKKEVFMKNDQETRLSLLEQTSSHIYQSLERMEKRFDKADEKFDLIVRNLGGLEQRIDTKHIELLNRIDSNNKWLIATAISASLGFLAIIVNVALRFYFHS